MTHPRPDSSIPTEIGRILDAFTIRGAYKGREGGGRMGEGAWDVRRAVCGGAPCARNPRPERSGGS